MQYWKVAWIHDFIDEPIFIYGELNDEFEEIRKVEMFRDGRLGYASIRGLEYLTLSSETNWLPKEEIEVDPQFIVEVISKVEFEKVWIQAISNNTHIDE